METFADYIAFSKTTAVYPNVGANPIYAVLGLAGETGEVAQKLLGDDRHGLIAELGDVLYYVARLSDELGIPVDLIKTGVAGTASNCVLTMSIGAGMVAEGAKKAMRDNAGEFGDNELGKAAAGLTLVIHGVTALCELYNVSVLEVAAQNTQKLMSRKARGVLRGNGDNR